MVTCGGLCPGLNDVIRSLVLTLYHIYGVKNVLGIRHGLQGFIPRYGHPVMELTPNVVAHIGGLGGTILSSSRGPQPIDEIVDALERMNIGILFAIGGDGTFRAVAKIADEIRARGAKLSVIGIPKTIDNDINLLSRSFGFNTAVSMATRVIAAAHVESTGAPNGVGLVKLMGRHSGFIAASAALAKRDANFVLIPESDFDLEGPHGLLAMLEKRLEERQHAVIVVAEGAGQKFLKAEGTDESGNPRLGDIGVLLKNAITDHFKAKGIEAESQVYRSELHDPFGGSHGQRLDLLRLSRSDRGRRGNGRENKYGGRDLERRVCLHPSKPGGSRAQAFGPAGQAVGKRSGGHGPALSKGKRGLVLCFTSSVTHRTGPEGIQPGTFFRMHVS